MAKAKLNALVKDYLAHLHQSFEDKLGQMEPIITVKGQGTQVPIQYGIKKIATILEALPAIFATDEKFAASAATTISNARILCISTHDDSDKRL